VQLIDGEVARLEKVVRQIDKTKKGDLEVTIKLQEWVKANKVRKRRMEDSNMNQQKKKKDVRDGDWAAAEIPHINSLQLLTAKPSIVLCNMTPDDYIRKKNKWLKKLADWAKGAKKRKK
jgi:ribosome-binding ATPase YchF (GTP1/OBG family)